MTSGEPSLVPSMQQPLSLVQRMVLVCLRDGGFPALAECAQQCWANGRPCRLPVAITDPELLREFEEANREPARRA